MNRCEFVVNFSLYIKMSLIEVKGRTKRKEKKTNEKEVERKIKTVKREKGGRKGHGEKERNKK